MLGLWESMEYAGPDSLTFRAERPISLCLDAEAGEASLRNPHAEPVTVTLRLPDVAPTSWTVPPGEQKLSIFEVKP